MSGDDELPDIGGDEVVNEQEDAKPTITDDNDDIPDLEETKGGENIPGLDNIPGGTGDFVGASGERKQNRSEKKARKAISKLGLHQVTDIYRVVIKRGKDAIFAISDPEVFKAPKKDIYIVFGEARVEDAGKELERAAQQFKANPNLQQQLQSQLKENDDEVPNLVEVEGENKETEKKETTAAVESEEGVEAKDIELVMQQVNCTRSQAIAALKKNGGDIVNAIMELQF